MRFLVHYALHFLAPGLIAYKFYPKKWKQTWLILVSTMIIDLDHLLATPIFDPNRLSIGFHYLHSYPAIVSYLLLAIYRRTRVIGVGLLFHIMTDLQDCLWILESFS